jgi:hypothetical protein
MPDKASRKAAKTQRIPGREEREMMGMRRRLGMQTKETAGNKPFSLREKVPRSGG